MDQNAVTVRKHKKSHRSKSKKNFLHTNLRRRILKIYVPVQTIFPFRALLRTRVTLNKNKVPNVPEVFNCIYTF